MNVLPVRQADLSRNLSLRGPAMETSREDMDIGGIALSHLILVKAW